MLFFHFFFFLHFINQKVLKKVSQISNIDNKSELHKMYFKVAYIIKFAQINAGLIIINDFLQKYKIVMYPNF